MSDDEKMVIQFRSVAPSARLKKFDVDDQRPRCRHNEIEIWPKEPIIECVTCGTVIDPYWWLRERCNKWAEVQNAVDWHVREAKAELVDLKDAIRLLRREYADEAEKRRAESRFMILPPRKRV